MSTDKKHWTTPIEAQAKNPTSLRAAINAKCWDCIGGDADPSPRGQIRDCSITDCPLWVVRPWQSKDKNETG